MDRDDIEQSYFQYLSDFNRGDLEAASLFYHQYVTYNDAPILRSELRDAILKEAREVLDGCKVEVTKLLIDEDLVAARILWTGQLIREWEGIPATNSPVSFIEHAIYRLKDSKCAEVWSIVDMEAARAAVR